MLAVSCISILRLVISCLMEVHFLRSLLVRKLLKLDMMSLRRLDSILNFALSVFISWILNPIIVLVSDWSVRRMPMCLWDLIIVGSGRKVQVVPSSELSSIIRLKLLSSASILVCQTRTGIHSQEHQVYYKRSHYLLYVYTAQAIVVALANFGTHHHRQLTAKHLTHADRQWVVDRPTSRRATALLPTALSK